MLSIVLLFGFLSSILASSTSLSVTELSSIKADLEREVAKMGTTKQADIVASILSSMTNEDKKSQHLANKEDEELYKLLLENTSPHDQTESTRKKDDTKELLDAVAKFIQENKRRGAREEIVEALIRNRQLIEKKDTFKNDKAQQKDEIDKKEAELLKLGLEGKTDDDVALTILNELTKKDLKDANLKAEKELERKILADDEIVGSIISDGNTKKSAISTKGSATTGSILQSLVKEELEKRLTVEVEDRSESKTSKDNTVVATVVKEDDVKKSETSTKDSVKKSEISIKESDIVVDEEENMLLSLIKEELEKRFAGQSRSKSDHSADTNELLKSLIDEAEVKKKDSGLATKDVAKDEEEVEKKEKKNFIITPKYIPQDDCVDEEAESYCGELKTMGFCETHRSRMDKCAKSCGYCKVCQGDIWKTTTCQRIQAIGYCAKASFKKKLEKYCHKTCGYCRIPSPPACMKHHLGCCWDNTTFVRDGCPACEDSRVFSSLVCRKFIHACGNPGEPGTWMKMHCPETCQMCRVNEEHLRKMNKNSCMDRTHACSCTDCTEFKNFSKRYCCKTCYECKKPLTLQKMVV